MLNLPKSLPNKLANDPELMTDIINKRSVNTNAALNAIKKGKTIVSFISDSQSIISSKQILDSIESNLKGPMFDSFSMLDDGTTTFNIVSTENKPLGISKQDKYFEGVRIENNPLQESSTKIETFLERLVCLNGTISPSVHWLAPKHMKGDVDEWLSDSIKKAERESRKMFDSINKLAQNKIDVNLMDFLDNMYEQLKVPETVRDLITRRIVKEGAANMYDIFNHVTHVASNYKRVREDESLSVRLMRIGGHFAQHLEDMCRTCSRPILSA